MKLAMLIKNCQFIDPTGLYKSTILVGTTVEIRKVYYPVRMYKLYCGGYTCCFSKLELKSVVKRFK